MRGQGTGASRIAFVAEGLSCIVADASFGDGGVVQTLMGKTLMGVRRGWLDYSSNQDGIWRGIEMARYRKRARLGITAETRPLCALR